MMKNEKEAPPPIFEVRGVKVMLDSDLAQLYGVETKVFNQSVRRNRKRFPPDFLFELTEEEFAVLRSQIVTLEGGGRGRHRKYLPLAFTEHGAIMAATLLKSPQAIAMSVYVVRAFVRMREELAASSKILQRLAEIDKRLLEHDLVLQEVIEKLVPLLEPPPEKPKRKIGFG